MINNNHNNGRRRWILTREKILMASGLTVIAFQLFAAEPLGYTFRLEFLLAGLALCGVSIAQWGDHKE